MKYLSKITVLFSNILHFMFYCVITLALLIAGFALYVKINPLDISFLISYLKEEQIIQKSTTVESLHLKFDDYFSIVAKNISIKAENIDLKLNNANIELSRSSLLQKTLAAKRIKINKADISINLDYMLAGNQETTEKPNYFATISKIKSITKWTKFAEINNSYIHIIYNDELQELDHINLRFSKSSNSLDFSAKGIYILNDNKAPITAAIHIDDNSKNIDLKITGDNLKSEDIIKTFAPNDDFNLNGTAKIIANANLTKENSVDDISGSIIIENGFVAIPNLYNNKLEFKKLYQDYKFNVNEKTVSINNAHLTDINNNEFTSFADFSFKNEPTLNITVKNQKKTIPLLQVFSYIPDLEFKKWLDKHIYQGTASNVSFGFYGPLRPIIDGEDGNPYFDISADFEDVALTYLNGIPPVENATGKFKMLNKDIDITIDNGNNSQQNIQRGSVKIAPLFEEHSPLITIKALSTGSVEDALNVLNKKLDLKQDELFSHYKGTQETQTTITLNLDRLNDVDSYNPKKDSFIKLNVRSDIAEVTGVDPIFKQRFSATDAIVNLTEENFTLEASGFMDENPFSLVLQEKLLEFGEHTKLKINSNFDPFLIKEYFDIPTFNISGLIYSELELAKIKDNWNFNLNANVEDSLVNFGLLNYTKPYSMPGFVNAEGFYNQAKNILNLKTSTIKTDDLSVNGSANIMLNDLPASTASYKNIKIKDKTDIDEFSLQSNILIIRGKSLDARPLNLAKQFKSNKEEDKKQTIKKINIRLDNLYLTDKNSLKKVSILLNNSNKLTGLIKAQKELNEQNLYINLTENKEKNSVRVESLIPDVGNYLRRTGLYKNWNSGYGIIFGDLIYDKNNKFDYANLQVNVKNFQVIKAPLLAQALASISLEQLFSKKDGILFDDLYSKIHYKDSIIRLDDAKIKGPSLGMLFNGAYDLKTKTTDIKGTIVPVVKLNSIVSNIPILGYILTGSQGAISGADFKVYGSQGKQKISVSPLSIITPGIVKDLFDSVTGDSNDESKAIKKARIKANAEEKDE